MKKWVGIKANNDPTGPGAEMVTNALFILEGEVTRRRPLEKQSAVSSSLGLAAFGAPNGTQYVAQVTSTGVLQVNAV